MAELYNEGLFRKGLVRTSGLVRPDLLLTFDDIFSPYAIDRLEAALALDFDSNVYRTGNKDTTFADAFMGNSPKLTYDPGSASSSQSTMVNSSGEIVWAPHNLALNSATPATQTITVTSGADYTVEVTGTGSMALSGAGTGTATDGSPATITASTTSLTITLTGSLDTVAVYRSDLGGMAPVPGAATGFEYYVPTNGSAEYLPRVGHHVYNGSAWVNEGLLIESEVRTNLITESTPQSGDLDVSGGSFSYVTCNFTPLSGPGIHFDTPGVSAYAYFTPTYTAADYTFSVFVEMDDGNAPSFTNSTISAVGNDFGFIVEASLTNPLNYTVEHYGGNTYRVSGTVTSSSTTARNTGIIKYSTNSTRTFKVTGFQLDQGEAIPNTNPVQYEDAPTPSSYIPTSGSTVTRGGQSLTVPPAQFGWPEPEYIGPELVTDGTFSDTANWTEGDAGWSVTGGALVGTAVPTNKYTGQSISSLPAGTLLYAVVDVSSYTVGDLKITLRDEQDGTNETVVEFGVNGTGKFTATILTTRTNAWLEVLSVGNTTMSIDNISVREINPLSVSIQMDGRMTYADEGVNTAARFYNWEGAGTNIIRAELATNGAYIGGANFMQYTPSFNNSSEDPPGSYTPGINVPFNISSRHGSTFVNGAVDGVALTANTTPTALPDLSGTDLQIAYDFMGTIGTFRQFAGDIGDTGLVTATNPSTEPTLSLTFNGTGGSYYNLSWSE